MTKYKIVSRDPAKVEKVRRVIDAAFDSKVEELQRLLTLPDPQPNDSRYFKSTRASYEKDITFRANATASQLRMIETMLDLTLTPAKEANADEAKAQQVRDIIAAVRGQMDPAKIAEMERELDETIDGGDDE